MSEVFGNMFKEFEFNEKPEKIITEVNGLNLPEDYLAFMSKHNGGEGPLGENGRMWQRDEWHLLKIRLLPCVPSLKEA